MGTIWSSGEPKSREQIEMALPKAKEIVASNPVVVFSKTYCGYCAKVKKLFKELNVSYKLIELDEESDGDEIQSALAEWTGQRTVPNVFISGKHIGGCDGECFSSALLPFWLINIWLVSWYVTVELADSAVMEKHQAGKLVPMLTEAGAIANNSAQL
ncbi:hypothetical protein OSB04_004246 [Centaurea solstitialis]|uniref:Glutaredoxin domain-containing protein n=1 Tax=Centaurea solstitialis TaxID=347529 RepID=A0AA38WU74_9ASTR|nr:hypothetical protein OSB04_004246 [Centaurea solstitialis]